MLKLGLLRSEISYKKLDIKYYIKPTNNSQSPQKKCHNPALAKAFINGECTRHANYTIDPHALKVSLENFKMFCPRDMEFGELLSAVKDA